MQQSGLRNKMRWLFLGIALAFKALITIGVLGLVFWAGTYASQVEFEPQTTTVIESGVECRLVERHTVQYVDKPVTVVRNIERVQRIPAELRNFNDLEELEQWLVAVSKNTTTAYLQLPGAKIDCDDYALDLQSKALADGYLMSFEVIGSGEYNGLFKSSKLPPNRFHAINLAIIDNDVYYIEPQTGEVVFAIRLD